MRPAHLATYLPGLAIWLGFSIVLGYFASLVFDFNKPRPHPPAWQQGAWIEAGHDKPTGYYRQHIVLPETPVRALLQVAAPDQYTLYVNGERVAENAFSSVFAAGVHDIAPYLKAGDNIIAVAVTRGTYPGSATLIAEGYWENADGTRGTIASGDGWRAVLVEEWQRGGEVAWYTLDFDDAGWPRAGRIEEPAGFVYAPLGLTMEDLAGYRIGPWLWLPQLSAKNGAFRRVIDLPGGGIDSARFGISTTASYSITVNGRVVFDSTPTREYMDSFDIAPFLQPGPNLIQVKVNRQDPGGQIAMAGWVRTSGSRVDLSSTAGWLAQSGDLIELHDKAWTVPTVYATVRLMENKIRLASGFAVIPLKHPMMREQTAYPASGALDPALTIGRYAGLAIVLNGALLWLFAALCRRVHPAMRPKEVLDAYLSPQLLALLVLIGLLLARFDVRFDSYAWFSQGVFVSFCAVLVAGLGVVLLEIMWRGRHALERA